MDLRPPVQSEAIGNLSQHDRRSDCTFGDVVGGRDIPFGQEHEELCLPSLGLVTVLCRLIERLQHSTGKAGDHGIEADRRVSL